MAHTALKENRKYFQAGDLAASDTAGGKGKVLGKGQNYILPQQKHKVCF